MNAPAPSTDPALRFAACVTEVLAHEGGYVDHPRDPGGCTNFGITRATLERWRGRPTDCSQVRALTVLEARQIYRARYWNGIRGDDLPAGIDLMVFDAAVNSGPANSARWLQQLVHVETDGAIGPVTLAAVRAQQNTGWLIHRLADIRMAFLCGLSTWPTFGKGWERRVTAVRRAALSMAGAA